MPQLGTSIAGNNAQCCCFTACIKVRMGHVAGTTMSTCSSLRAASAKPVGGDCTAQVPSAALAVLPGLCHPRIDDAPLGMECRTCVINLQANLL